MPLVTWFDLHADSHTSPDKKVYELVSARTHDDEQPMPPPPNPRLGSEDLAVLEAWTAAGAPAAVTEETCGASTPIINEPLSCLPDVHMRPASAWEMPETTEDEYVCYGFDVTTETKRHLIGVAPRIDNSAIVHHLALFEAPEAVSPTPERCSPLMTADWRIVYGWAPGGGNFEFPRAAGYPQEGTTHYVVQLHYSNVLRKKGQKDATGFDFCTTDELRPNDADTIVFGTFDFTVPARSALDLTCDAKMPPSMPDIHLFAALPHMHELGKFMSTTKLHSDGTVAADLGTQPTWDFDNQIYIPISATVSGGDTVRTRCAWRNPHAWPVDAGRGTEDEMCFSFSFYWPKIASTGFSWMGPALSSKCRETP